MNLERFLEHHGLSQNPFDAEEARHDPVFQRLAVQAQQNHPDFAKIAGKVDQPSSAVVFGEKGSGKTATRLLIEQRVKFHNEAYEDKRVVLVAYDDLNPVLDNFLQARQARQSFFSRGKKNDQPLEDFRLQDHQDAILSLAVTRMVDGLLGKHGDQSDPLLLPTITRKKIKAIPKSARMNALILAALYDQPRAGNAIQRWKRLQKVLGLQKWVAPVRSLQAAIGLTIVNIFLGVIYFLLHKGWVIPYTLYVPHIFVLLTMLLVGLWVYWIYRIWRLPNLVKDINKDTPVIRRERRHLFKLLSRYCTLELYDQPWPHTKLHSDSRYALTQRLMGFLGNLGYKSMTILVDRVDEPAAISGNPDRMRSIVWPMLDNKFLQQESVCAKLLLPIELHHMLKRENAEFFQTARLDKQHTIVLVWSGATLYDLCSSRLAACQKDSTKQMYLTDLFDPEVTREVLIEALDDMQQPREAFKFLYGVLQEHCRMSTQEQPRFLIPRLTLDAIRRQHAQRVADLRRGLTPV